MITPGGMRWIDARSIEGNDIVLRDGKLTRVIRLEWPYAVIRLFEAARGEFGERKITRLEGRYFVPSRRFLREAGLYDSRLLSRDEPEAFVIDLDDVVGMEENGREVDAEAPRRLEGVPPGSTRGNAVSESDASGELDVEVEESDEPLSRSLLAEGPLAVEWPIRSSLVDLRRGDELAFESFAREPSLERAGSRDASSSQRPGPAF